MCKITQSYPIVQYEEKKKVSEVLSCMDSPIRTAVKEKNLHFWTKIKYNQNTILQHRKDFYFILFLQDNINFSIRLSSHLFTGNRG